MEDKIKKIKKLLGFYNKDGGKIKFSLKDHRHKVEGSIVSLWSLWSPYVVMGLKDSSQMKIFLEDIDPESIFPAVLKEAGGRKALSPKVRLHVLKRDGYSCVKCGRGKEGELEVDHIVPVSLGGSDELDNLQTLCFECNRGKGGNLEDD